MPFTLQKITKAKNLGEKLIEARTDAGVGLEKAAKDLNIAFKYLEALENNNLAGLPGRPYLKNFLQLYCQYLRLNFADCWNDARRLEIKEQKKYKNIEGRYFLMWPKFIKRAIIGLIVAAILIFLALSIEKIFTPPPLQIIQPQDGLITKTRQIEIIGQSQKEVEIIINNNNVFVDNEGGFQTTLDLQNGLNLIKITAKKRYGRAKEVDLRVLLNE